MGRILTFLRRVFESIYSLMKQTYPVGEFRNRKYLISFRADPSIRQPDDFAVTLFKKEFNDGDPERTEIAKIDNSHGHPHFEKKFLESRKTVDIDLSFRQAHEKIKENWKEYARRFWQNHS